MELVEILLSTYKGSAFLSQQLDSLLNQSYANIRIIIRDDGSNDFTLNIINKFVEINREKIKLLPYEGNLGSGNSFMRLLEKSEANYVMFCDQDDVWCRNKVSDSLGAMRRLEHLYGKNEPLLVFTDLTVVDSRLRVLCRSLWESQRLDPALTCNWKKLLAQNVVSGCTIMVTKNIKDFLRPTSTIQIHHDHLIAVVASKYGHIGWIDKPTMLYRQHGGNVVGALGFNWFYVLKKIRNLKKIYLFFVDASKYFAGEVGVLELIYFKLISSIRRLI